MHPLSQRTLRTPLRAAIPFAVLAGLICFATGTAHAEETASDTQAMKARTELIPAHRKSVTREITTPAVMGNRRVPVYESVEVPVYEMKRTPRYRTVEVPVYATRMEPQYRTERVPRYEWREQPVRELDLESTSITLPNPFACDCDLELPFLPRPELECKTERVRVCVGYDTRTVPCGMKPVRYQSGTETRQVLDGYDTEQVQTGTRTDRILTGYRNEPYEICPARTRIVTECIVVPAKRVEVVADDKAATHVSPVGLPVMSESEFQQALAQAHGAANAS